MDKNNTTSASNSSVCSKIRQALASSSAVRVINRISSHHQEPKHATYGSSSTSPSTSSFPANTTPIQTKPHIPQQHVRANAEASGLIPINFDYSPPKPIERGNKAIPSAHGQVARVPPPFVANSESATKVAAKGEHHQHGHGHGHGHHGVHLDQQGEKSVDMNDTFNEYIERAKKKIRTITMSTGHRGQNNSAQDHHESHVGAANENEHHKDPFSDFIHRAKKKLRTTTIVGKSSSLRKGTNTAQDHESHGGAADEKEHHKDQFLDFIHRAKKKLRTTTTGGKSSSLRKG